MAYRPLVRPPPPSKGGSRLALQIALASVGVLLVAGYLVFRWFLACGFGEECAEAGLCKTDGGMCVAASDEHCRDAVVCRQKGFCVAKDGKCTAGHDRDCKQSAWCKEYGMCSLESSECIAVSDEDCRQSEKCQKHRQCVAKAGSCVM